MTHPDARGAAQLVVVLLLQAGLADLVADRVHARVGLSICPW